MHNCETEKGISECWILRLQLVQVHSNLTVEDCKKKTSHGLLNRNFCCNIQIAGLESGVGKQHESMNTTCPWSCWYNVVGTVFLAHIVPRLQAEQHLNGTAYLSNVADHVHRSYRNNSPMTTSGVIKCRNTNPKSPRGGSLNRSMSSTSFSGFPSHFWVEVEREFHSMNAQLTNPQHACDATSSA